MLGDIQFRDKTLSWSGKRRNAGPLVRGCKDEETSLVSSRNVNLKPFHTTIYFIYVGQSGLRLLNVAGTVFQRDDHLFLNWWPHYSKLLDSTCNYFLCIIVVLYLVPNTAFMTRTTLSTVLT